MPCWTDGDTGATRLPCCTPRLAYDLPYITVISPPRSPTHAPAHIQMAVVLPSFSDSPAPSVITSAQPTSAVSMVVNVTNPMLWMSATVSVTAGLDSPATFAISLLFNTTEILTTNKIVSSACSSARSLPSLYRR